MDVVGLIAGSGWASGLNLYLVTLLLGLAGRLGWSDIPDLLTRADVMVVAGVLFVIEFFADKIPYVDNLWDVIHTFVRPVGAAALGAVIAGDSETIGSALGAIVAGALALDAHSAKATTRVVANTSPEPLSNLVLSVVEDLSVGLLVVLAITFPVITVIVVAVLVVAAAAVTSWLWRVARRGWRRLREHRWRSSIEGG